MVVTGIFMILSGVVLTTNARFGSLIVLQNLAHDMALSVRQAQVYGIAVRRYEAANFDVSYGIHFSTPGEEAPMIYELFADVNRNGAYDTGDAIVNSTTVNSAYRLADLCVRSNTGLEDCSISTADVVFRRPEPDACIGSGGAITFNQQFECVSQMDRARVVLESRSGEQSEVLVEASGQISVH
jgi:hypothetical protein